MLTNALCIDFEATHPRPTGARLGTPHIRDAKRSLESSRLDPPPSFSAAEKEWFEKNKALPYEVAKS